MPDRNPFPDVRRSAIAIAQCNLAGASALAPSEAATNQRIEINASLPLTIHQTATTASRLGLTLREMPAAVHVLNRADLDAAGAIVQTSDRLRRAQRWLFAFPHSFDLPQLLALRPAWDAWMLGFSLAGLGLTAVVTGWRRLFRVGRRHHARTPHEHPFFPSPSPPAGGGWAHNLPARRFTSLPQDLP